MVTSSACVFRGGVGQAAAADSGHLQQSQIQKKMNQLKNEQVADEQEQHTKEICFLKWGE